MSGEVFDDRGEIARKQLLQNVADQGQLFDISVLGMMLIAEGIERKQEALIILNNAYVNTRRSWNLRHTCNKVQNHLVRRINEIKFHGLHRSCANHPFVSSYRTTFMEQYNRYKRLKFLARCSRVSFKKMNYFSLTPRLKRLYASKATAASMQWHSENHAHYAGIMCHPSDSESWKHFDKIHPSFAAEVSHPYRKDKNKFKKNRKVIEGPPPSMNGVQTLWEIEQLGLVKVTKLNVDDVNKRCGDHGKTKDNVAARRDLKLYFWKRKGVKDNERAYYALDKNQKKSICQWVEKLCSPDGYVSNLGRNLNQLKKDVKNKARVEESVVNT
ncbi:unnamed protein product [Lactuca saligna]|uniref:Uncharacterized protein n=1 Tax=Lactuca saligna TaxID=75948 RepID=A0AA36EET4_LACSI|nr:unnamed protein product [Lactuca saligna]